MLFLLFQLNESRYALEAGCVLEILPLVEIKKLPHAAPGVAGLFYYRGAPVPVIDLSALALGRPARERLSTRLLLVNLAAPGAPPHRAGLIAERATGTIQRDSAEFVDSGLAVRDAPFLGPVLRDSIGLIQRIELARLPVRESLLQPSLEAA